jgi:hypothetical protein
MAKGLNKVITNQGKKCIPGWFCIENMTLFILVVLAILGIYFYYTLVIKPTNINITVNSKTVPDRQSTTIVSGIATRLDPINDPYTPPMRADGMYFPPDSGDIRGIPVNIRTRGQSMSYQQVGILTRRGNTGESILPLMGRQVMNGRDKWQYYTMTNSGNLNTKLPIRVNGRSCTGEYGCDSVNDGDVVYVQGYNDTFVATIYENSLFQYIPF